jgi:hypothetical protein
LANENKQEKKKVGKMWKVGKGGSRRGRSWYSAKKASQPGP